MIWQYFGILLLSLIYCSVLQANRKRIPETDNNGTTLTIPAWQLSSDGVNGVRFMDNHFTGGSQNDDQDKRFYKGGIDPELGVWNRESSDNDLFLLPHETDLPYTENRDREQQASQRLLMAILLADISAQEKIIRLRLLESLVSIGLNSHPHPHDDPRTEPDQFRDLSEWHRFPSGKQAPGEGRDSGNSQGQSRAATGSSGATGGTTRRVFLWVPGGSEGQAGSGGDDPEDRRGRKRIRVQCEEDEVELLLSLPKRVEVEIEEGTEDEAAAGTHQTKKARPGNLLDVEIIPRVWRTDSTVRTDSDDKTCHELVSVETDHGFQEVELSYPKNLMCQICSGIMLSPSFSCAAQNHFYCMPCLNNVRAVTVGNSFCPECRAEQPETLMVCGFIEREIGHLKVRCPQCQSGMEFSDIANHLNRFCLQRPVSCPRCNMPVPPDQLKAHTESCILQESAACPRSQTEQGYVNFIRRLLVAISDQDDSVEESPHRQCPDCEGVFSHEFYQEHLQLCPQKTLCCKHCGQVAIRQDYVANHGDQCPRRIVRCSHPGCNAFWIQGVQQKIPHQIKLDDRTYHNEDREGIRYSDGLYTVVISSVGSNRRLGSQVRVAYTIPQWNLQVGFYWDGDNVWAVFAYIDNDCEAEITKGMCMQVEIFSESGGVLGGGKFRSKRWDCRLDEEGKKFNSACIVPVSDNIWGQTLYYRLTLMPGAENSKHVIGITERLKGLLSLPKCDRRK